MTTTEIQALVDDCRSHDRIQHWRELRLLDAITTLLARDNIKTFAEQEARIAELEARIKSQRSRISQLTHGMADERKANSKLLARLEQMGEWNSEALAENNRLDTEADMLLAELARVKAESLRVVADGDQCAVEIIPTGLRVALHGRQGIFRRVGSGAAANPLRSFLLFEDCHSGNEIEVEYGSLGTPVRLERWEDEG